MRKRCGGPESGQSFTSEMVNAHGFWARVQKGDGCWEWQGVKNLQTGYGTFNVIRLRKGPVAAHRVAFVLKHGSIPDGALVMHRCDNKTCVNPAHLELGTNDQNMRDALTRERMWWQRDRTCRSGHFVAAYERCAICARVTLGKAKVRATVLRREMASDVLDTFVQAEIIPVIPSTFEGCVAKADERRAKIVAHFFGLYGHPLLTLTALGRKYGITRERCRQLRDDALIKLGLTEDVVSRTPRVGGWKRMAASAGTVAA